jgi:hypothetical protein
MVAKARCGTKKTRNEKPIHLFIFLSLTWIREKYSFKDKLSMRFRVEIPANFVYIPSRKTSPPPEIADLKSTPPPARPPLRRPARRRVTADNGGGFSATNTSQNGEEERKSGRADEDFHGFPALLGIIRSFLIRPVVICFPDPGPDRVLDFCVRIGIREGAEDQEKPRRLLV